MNYIRLFVLTGLLIGLVVVFINCASVTKPIETEPNFIGFITEIHPSQERGTSGLISVESHVDEIITRYTVTIKDETLIFQQDGDNLRNVAFTTLETKQWVRIWFSGPVTLSWPLRGTAKQIVIIE